MNGFRSMPKKEKEYPTLITSENMDAVIDLMLDRKDEEEIVHLDYKDVSCLLNISKGQYKNIIEEFKKDGLIEQCGYGDKYKLLYGIHKKKEYGGYCMEKDAYVAGLQNLQLQLEKVQKELSQTAIGKINSVISGMNNISDLASNIGKILDIIHRSLPTQ